MTRYFQEDNTTQTRNIYQEVQFAIVHNPILDQTWTAQKGQVQTPQSKGCATWHLLHQGAFCNGERIHVSGCEKVEKCLLVQEMGATDPEKVKMVLTNMETFMPKV